MLESSSHTILITSVVKRAAFPITNFTGTSTGHFWGLRGIGFTCAQDLLDLELRTTHRELPHPDRIIAHRKGVPGNEEEEHLAYELRCYPNTAQVPSLASVQPAHMCPLSSLVDSARWLCMKKVLMEEWLRPFLGRQAFSNRHAGLQRPYSWRPLWSAKHVAFPTNIMHSRGCVHFCSQLFCA